MRDEKEIKLPCPLPGWMMFMLPLALNIIRPSTWLSVGLYLIVIFLFILLTLKQANLWRLRSYAINLVLLISTLASYHFFPEYHTIWTLIAMSLSTGWRWGLNLHLCQVGIPQYLPIAFSSALFMHTSIFYFLLYVIMGLLGYQHGIITNSWVPIGLIIITSIISTWHVRKSEGVVQHFSCPDDSPLVRMAIVRNNEVWLTSHPYTGCFMDLEKMEGEIDCGCCKKTDQPLTSCIHPGESPDDALSRAIKNSQLKSKIPPRHLLKYSYDYGSGSREVHLYVINIRPKEGALMLAIRGRFYSPHEIEELSKMDYFSSLFLQEYNYLCHTLFPANALAEAHSKQCK